MFCILRHFVVATYKHDVLILNSYCEMKYRYPVYISCLHLNPWLRIILNPCNQLYISVNHATNRISPELTLIFLVLLSPGVRGRYSRQYRRWHGHTTYTLQMYYGRDRPDYHGLRHPGPQQWVAMGGGGGGIPGCGTFTPLSWAWLVRPWIPWSATSSQLSCSSVSCPCQTPEASIVHHW